MTIRNHKIWRTARPLLYGCLTGIISGAIIALFLVCARVVAHFALDFYKTAVSPLAIVCLLLLTLLCCLLMAVLQILYPHSKGSGIPLAECCARGMLSVKWLRAAASLIAGSLLAFLSGMTVGSEGPSIGVGGLIGEGIGKTAKKPTEFRRYLITGGASAGLAVAFNAPLTGVTFALEETHRRFSPGILLAAFSAVVPAVMISQTLFWAFGHNAYLAELGVGAGMSVLPYLAQTGYTDIVNLLTVCGIAAICGIVCAAIATVFNYAVFALGAFFGKIKRATVRLLPAFLLTAACGLCMYITIGSGEATLEHVSIDSAMWLLFTLLAVRLMLTAVAGGSGMTGGLFLPMIAIGGLLGTISAKLSIMFGANAAYAPNIIMLCIASFFAASVRAPISAIAMTVELTFSFANLLPCAIAVSIATATAGLLRSAPLYERMMENLQNVTPVPEHHKNITVVGRVFPDSVICGKRIRDILWPYNSLVTELMRGKTDIVPDGETTLCEGDIITVRAERVDPEFFADQIRDYVDNLKYISNTNNNIGEFNLRI